MEQQYTGNNNVTTYLNPPYLVSNLNELKILADSTENRLGLTYTTKLINFYCHNNVFDAVFRSTVNLAFLRLAPKITRIQGVEKLKSSSSMSKFCCITDLIRFMMKEAENLMKGYVHEDDFFIVNDALVLMTAKETIEWMKEKNYFHRSLLPMNGLQDSTPYAGCPVGNSPEFMTLDNSLNSDILQSLRFHCVLSRFMLDGEGTNE